MKSASKIGSKLIVTILMAVIVLSIICIGIYIINSPDKTKKVATSPDYNLNSLVSNLNGQLQSKYTYLQTTALPGTITNGYQVNGYTFQVILPQNHPHATLTDTRSQNESKVYNDLYATIPQINNYLKNQGFTSVPSSHSQNLLSAIRFYRRSNAVCQITIYTQLNIVCASSAQLSKIAETANPLVAQYVDASSNTNAIAITNPVIQPSKTVGYSIAILTVFGSNGETKANFYKHGNDSWELVNLKWYNDPHEDGDIIPNCQDFESVPIIRQAFLGQACYNSQTRSMTTIN